MNAEKPAVLVLCGPTASGKTSLACRLTGYDVEIVSADSRQVYRQMDVGTAKPTPEEQALVPHHMIDIVDPDDDFSVADFVAMGREVIDGILSRGRLPLVVGGTGLYVRGLIDGLIEAPGADAELRKRLHATAEAEGADALHAMLQRVDPDQAATIHPNNIIRVIRAIEVYELTGQPLSALQQDHASTTSPYRTLKMYLDVPRHELDQRIQARTRAMFAAGLVEEVAGILAQGYSPELKALNTIGYREVIQHLEGRNDEVECVEQVIRETRRYARRQETWFRKEKLMISVDSSAEIDKIQQLIDCFLVQKGSGYGQDTI